MKKILLVAVAAAGLVSVAPAFAVDGTITINGAVTGTTCTIANNGNVTVTLPSVSTTSLTANGAVAGQKAFALNLSGCAASTKATAYFEPGANIDPATGNLRNATGAGNATNVQVQLYNSDLSAINLFSNNAKQVTIGTAGPMNFYAGYYATGQATAGTVATSVIYTMTYQ
ncbi:type 1 fimbrial protein [Lysobacter soli]|uniref:fimbrial protein n=1 Tax=Lysobacter TaxID=68 RepID=UPI00178B3938|nr:fimbrial protein [Lysobacter soli]UTA54855.1 type 1 fimbrial protein [Lysobacter soli]